MARRACASFCGQSRCTTSPDFRRPSRWPMPFFPDSDFRGAVLRTIETDDPDALGEALRAIEPAPTVERARNIQDGRQAARPASFRPERTAPRRACADRRDRAARRRTARRDQRQCGRMHAVPVLRIGLSHRRAARRSRTSCAQICRRRLRAVRIVPEHMPGKGDHAEAADRFPRRQGTARGSSRKKSRRFASAATSRSASRARSTRSRRSSRAGTGCIPRATSGWTRSGCAPTAASSR